MKKNHPILFVGLLLTLALLSAALWSVASAAQDDTPVTDRAVVERAWALTHKSNSFAYTSRITQTVHPAATLGNIGRTPKPTKSAYRGGSTVLPNPSISRFGPTPPSIPTPASPSSCAATAPTSAPKTAPGARSRT